MANDIFDEALSILQKHGASIACLDCSGKLTRCATANKPNKRNFAYKFHADLPANISFTNWELGGQWKTVILGRDTMADLTGLERQQLQERIRQRQEADKKAYELALQKTMAKALKFYSSLPIAGKDNAYLIKKGIPTYPNLRQCNNGNLAVPVYDSKNRLCSLQFIMADGQKRFMAGRLPETYLYPFKAKDGGKDGPLVIAEGFGTAAAIYESTGYAVLASFSAGNLEATAQFAKSIYPERLILIACDFDEPNQTYTNAGGTGVALAKQAAQAINGKLAIPPLPDGFEKVDFNDLYLHKDYGLAGVRGIINEALVQPAIEKGQDLQLNNQEKQSKYHIIDFFDFVNLSLPEREDLIAPILQIQGIGMIHASRGLGKTFFSLSLAYAVAAGGNVFGKWKVPKPAKVIYIDGEMPARAMQDRLIALAAGMTDGDIKNKDMFTLLTPDLQDCSMPDLSTPEGQKAINGIIEDRDFVVLDNLATLCRSNDPNEEKFWRPIQSWLLELRRQGKTSLIVHHSGKNGLQRGTSSKEDILDLVIGLRRPDNYDAAMGANFEVHFEKARHLTGPDCESFEATLVSSNGQDLTWSTRPIQAKQKKTDELDQQVKELLSINPEYPIRKMALELDVDKGKIERAMRRIKSESLFDNPMAI